MVWLKEVWKLSDLPVSSVMGTGTALDSARLRHDLAGKMGLDSQSVPAVINRNGVAELIEYHMAGEEQEAFERSLDVIEQVRNQIGQKNR